MLLIRMANRPCSCNRLIVPEIFNTASHLYCTAPLHRSVRDSANYSPRA